MTADELKKLTQEIVIEARELSLKHTKEADAEVNYVCVFAQSEAEYEELLALAKQLGRVAQDTVMGPVFHIAALSTVAGDLELLKIRRPDLKRTERGDADFTVKNYEELKEKYFGKSGWDLIVRPEFEMLELVDKEFNVLAYYSHPTLAEVLGIK